MKRPFLLICLSILLVLSIALNCFFLFRTDSPDLSISLSKPLTFDDDREVSSAYTVSLDDRTQTEIILLSFINAQPVPAAEAPTSLPDGVITIRYQGTGYPYRIWFADDGIIISSGNDIFRRISNDHTDPVPLIRELIGSISTEFPG